MAALERVGLAYQARQPAGRALRRPAAARRVARALVGEPDLLLADEPTGNLDSASTAEVLDLLDELHGHGRTIVLITHEAEVAATPGAWSGCSTAGSDRTSLRSEAGAGAAR